MFEEIEDVGTELSRELLDELKFRVQQRRTVVSDVIHFLKSPHNPHPIGKYITVANQKSIERSLKGYASKFGLSVNSTAQTTEDQVDEHDKENRIISFEEKMRIVVENANCIDVSFPPSSQDRTVRRAKRARIEPFEMELKALKTAGMRGEIMNKVLHNLLKITPTSVDSERAFSLAGLFVTKIRSWLGHKSIFALTLLNSHFVNEKKQQQDQQSS